ncbi:DUF3103 family protein [Luteibacter rhizovicinus]|uniref:DUF3103 family protein n=1 Tax=Luteibacter rhizovicinus TaxID=242606 RepID=A0A4R3YT80_9GAMM|nr:DUF3103 family protein [Luteibacter rhizovicinus]TCV95731.1 DUF3103 family protein [Luteibacter rhizovicinus]
MKWNTHKKLLATALALCLSAPLLAAPDTANPVAAATRDAAQTVAGMLGEPAFDRLLGTRLLAGPAQLHDLVSRYQNEHGISDATRHLREADRQALHAKGLDGMLAGAFEVRLVLPAGSTGVPQDLSTLLVAAAPQGERDDSHHVKAYDASGKVEILDVDAGIDRPLLVVDINGDETLRAGLEVVSAALQDAGLQSPGSPVSRARAASKATGDLTKLTSLRLEWDHERDGLGPDAEVFALVMGINKAGTGAEISPVPLRWVDHDKVTYESNFPIVVWDDYSIDAVNIQLWEDDGDTNFQEIAVNLVKAGTAALASNPGTAPYALIGKISEAVIGALSKEYFFNKPDYVDEFHLIRRGKNYDGVKGVVKLEPDQRNNATASFKYEGQ